MNATQMSKAISSPAPVQLAPPGAGLPAAELQIARLLFRWRIWRGNAQKFNRSFDTERARIRALYAGCDPALAGRPILISRLPGMEDSSRHWSVWMTLDHLRRVNNSIAGVIKNLANEVAPPGQASTAAVKPDPGADSSIQGDYENSCAAVLAAANESPHLATAARFSHPWFGPLDAFAWFGLAGAHMAIHRKQIEQILRILHDER